MKSKSAPFHHYCKSHYLSLGFRRANGCYLRNVNDLFQAFSLHFFAGASPECTVRFSIRPLCERIEAPCSEDYDLFDLTAKAQIGSEGWNVCTSAGAPDYSKVITAIESRLIPLFQSAESCESALAELQRIEDEIENNRLDFLRRNAITDMADSFSERSLLSETKLYLALKSNNYAYAEKALEVFMANANHYKPAFMERIRVLSKLVVRRDCDAINAILLENEAYSIEKLKAYGVEV